MPRRYMRRRGRRSSSSSQSRQSQYYDDFDLNPQSEDRMALFQELVPARLPVSVPPANRAAKIFQRWMTLLDNLVNGVSGGHRNKRHIEVKRHIPTLRFDERNKRKFFDLQRKSRQQDEEWHPHHLARERTYREVKGAPVHEWLLIDLREANKVVPTVEQRLTAQWIGSHPPRWSNDLQVRQVR